LTKTFYQIHAPKNWIFKPKIDNLKTGISANIFDSRNFINFNDCPCEKQLPNTCIIILRFQGYAVLFEIVMLEHKDFGEFVGILAFNGWRFKILKGFFFFLQILSKSSSKIHFFKHKIKLSKLAKSSKNHHQSIINYHYHFLIKL
jgi:hypothetical protein